MLLVLLLAGAAQAKAIDYGLKIAGKDVTNYNCEDLSVIPGVKGTVKFDPIENILYLENATITVTGESENALVIDNSVTINVTGENTISSVDTAVKLNGAQNFIKGNGTLNVNSSTYDCINLAMNGSLEIDECTVNLMAHASGIFGDMHQSSTVNIRNAKVTVRGYYGAIRYLKALTIEGGTITQPDGAAFSSTKGAVVVDDRNVEKETIVIEPKDNYSILVAGVEITKDNCNDLSVIPGVSGTASYDPAAKMLNLENATINYDKKGGAITNNNLNGFTINVTGENNISSNSSAVASLKNLIIDGTGTLNVNSEKGCGIYLDESYLKIRNCTVNAKGNYGIAGAFGSETFTVTDANVTAEGKTGSICDFASLTLNYCKIVQPDGAVFDESKNAVVLDGKTVTDKVIIEKFIKYGVTINNVEVTSDNCNDLSVIEGVSGTVKYDHESKTLTLDNATINGVSMCISNYDLFGLAINVKGENYINSDNTSIYLYRYTLINGDGTLNVKAKKYNAIKANTYDPIKIVDCTLNIEGVDHGICGDSFYRPNLTIIAANVKSQGSKGAISDFSSVTLDKCSIAEPESAAYDPKYKNVMVNGETATRVVIKYDPTADIDNITTTRPAHKQGIYSLDGVYLGNDFDALPKGIYIKDGKKVLK